MLMHMVFNTVKESWVLVDLGLSCSLCCKVISWGCVVGYVGFRCHVRCVLFGVGGIVDVGQGCGGGFECAMSGSYRFSMTVCVLGGCVGGSRFYGGQCVWQADGCRC
jgi:hypothetical protein